MNNKSLRLTINQLVLSNVYMGDNYQFINTKIKPFLLGYKNGYHIINLSFTCIQIKLLINILVNLVSLRQKLLIVKDLDFFNLTVLLNYNNVFFYNKKWIGGVLTNFRTVRKSSKFKVDNKHYNTLGVMRYLPALVFLFNTNISKWALLEAHSLEIPIAGVINSNSTGLDFVNYPILGNNQSFEAIYLYVNILKNAIMKGKQKERLNIMRIL